MLKLPRHARFPQHIQDHLVLVALVEAEDKLLPADLLHEPHRRRRDVFHPELAAHLDVTPQTEPLAWRHDCQEPQQLTRVERDVVEHQVQHAPRRATNGVLSGPAPQREPRELERLKVRAEGRASRRESRATECARHM